MAKHSDKDPKDEPIKQVPVPKTRNPKKRRLDLPPDAELPVVKPKVK